MSELRSKEALAVCLHTMSEAHFTGEAGSFISLKVSSVPGTALGRGTEMGRTGKVVVALELAV